MVIGSFSLILGLKPYSTSHADGSFSTRAKLPTNPKSLAICSPALSSIRPRKGIDRP